MMQNSQFKVVLVTGGFDPLHSGHINYLRAAKSLGDQLVVGLNSDAWLTRKKGRPFMPLVERQAIISELKVVDGFITFDDSDGSAKNAIKYCLENTFNNETIIFANGGDRTQENIPEMEIVDPRLEFWFSVGGDNKMNSSSWILNEWKAPKTEREWGYYRVLHEHGNHVKLKELTVEPGKSLSMQKHHQRSEFWFVAEGVATVNTLNKKSDFEQIGVYKQHEHMFVPNEKWHQLVNNESVPLKLIEIQYGENCVEEDIERK
jgi:cytidyltransferase-like protein